MVMELAIVIDLGLTLECDTVDGNITLSDLNAVLKELRSSFLNTVLSSVGILLMEG